MPKVSNLIFRMHYLKKTYRKVSWSVLHRLRMLN